MVKLMDTFMRKWNDFSYFFVSGCFIIPLFVRQFFQRPTNKLLLVISFLFLLVWLIILLVYIKRNNK